MFPKGKPNPNFNKMIPDIDSDAGLIELISTFGVDVIRDEEWKLYISIICSINGKI